ncbi:MAG: hypothetical protein HGA78_06170, partial [Nitrospirales bacterium]|nr:hypothetical protein [Nitrospirales bacterium]
ETVPPLAEETEKEPVIPHLLDEPAAKPMERPLEMPRESKKEPETQPSLAEPQAQPQAEDIFDIPTFLRKRLGDKGR